MNLTVNHSTHTSFHIYVKASQLNDELSSLSVVPYSLSEKKAPFDVFDLDDDMEFGRAFMFWNLTQFEPKTFYLQKGTYYFSIYNNKEIRGESHVAECVKHIKVKHVSSKIVDKKRNIKGSEVKIIPQNGMEVKIKLKNCQNR